jgi:hypothetical protein
MQHGSGTSRLDAAGCVTTPAVEGVCAVSVPPLGAGLAGQRSAAAPAGLPSAAAPGTSPFHPTPLLPPPPTRPSQQNQAAQRMASSCSWRQGRGNGSSHGHQSIRSPCRSCPRGHAAVECLPAGYSRQAGEGMTDYPCVHQPPPPLPRRRSPPALLHTLRTTYLVAPDPAIAHPPSLPPPAAATQVKCHACVGGTSVREDARILQVGGRAAQGGCGRRGGQ